MRDLKQAALGLLAISLVGCSTSPSASRAPSPSAFGPAPLRCSLPVLSTGLAGGVEGTQNGFISIPSGTFKPDANEGGLSYDRALGRWVPVPAAWVLPDGSAYVYERELPAGPFQIHLVSVASGADHVIYEMPYDTAFEVLAYRPEGVYLVPILHRSGVPEGLWMLDLATGSLRTFPESLGVQWQVVSTAEAWGAPGPGAETLNHLDLATGAVAVWFHHTVQEAQSIGSRYGVTVVGWDASSRPIVEFYPPVDKSLSSAPSPAPELWIVSAPGTAHRLTDIPLPDQPRPGFTDSHGTWLVGADGVYLYGGSRFERVAPLPPGPVRDLTVVGACR
jgi:hypothetical protein